MTDTIVYIGRQCRTWGADRGDTHDHKIAYQLLHRPPVLRLCPNDRGPLDSLLIRVWLGTYDSPHTCVRAHVIDERLVIDRDVGGDELDSADWTFGTGCGR